MGCAGFKDGRCDPCPGEASSVSRRDPTPPRSGLNEWRIIVHFPGDFVLKTFQNPPLVYGSPHSANIGRSRRSAQGCAHQRPRLRFVRNPLVK